MGFSMISCAKKCRGFLGFSMVVFHGGFNDFHHWISGYPLWKPCLGELKILAADWGTP